jgi:hypothetical protein
MSGPQYLAALRCYDIHDDGPASARPGPGRGARCLSAVVKQYVRIGEKNDERRVLSVQTR